MRESDKPKTLWAYIARRDGGTMVWDGAEIRLVIRPYPDVMFISDNGYTRNYLLNLEHPIDIYKAPDWVRSRMQAIFAEHGTTLFAGNSIVALVADDNDESIFRAGVAVCKTICDLITHLG